MRWQIFGQRLTIQATASQGHDHEMTVKELNTKFLYSLIALITSLIMVVVAATAIIWVKDPTTRIMAGLTNMTDDPLSGNYYTAWCSTAIGAVLGCATITSLVQMYCRLHTARPADSVLRLRTAGGKAVPDSSEFYVAGGEQ